MPGRHGGSGATMVGARVATWLAGVGAAHGAAPPADAGKDPVMGGTLIVAESYGHRLTAFAIAPDGGGRESPSAYTGARHPALAATERAS